ncbi:GNAT family N-acetyltransferase [Microvirga rosea]|uniref:GNAT family N-acetyltransferase n=1 Tax=Microvirga rosea TaxID=2715425 RepID=UPI001D0AD89B|nr:GNAT family N-acetyltransferase [Microvirga rosea]MCB8822135.1 GNAT family N-acetyltransferase [Microvirga rosea]
MENLAAIRHLTFPAVYDIVRERYPSQFYAVAAFIGSDAIGLAIGVAGPRSECEVLSVYVVDFCRRQGIGSSLLLRLEQTFLEKGFRKGVHFLTVNPEEQGPVRFLMSRGWNRPVIVKLICRSTLRQAFETPWLVRAKLPDQHRVISWSALTSVQRSTIAAGIEKWIPDELDPFSFENGSDIGTSIALVAGADDHAPVAGWVLTHRLDASTLRWTCSFIDPSIQGKARILPLWLEVARRQKNVDGLENFVFTIPLSQPRMVRFATRYMRPWLTGLDYSCMTMKELTPTMA